MTNIGWICPRCGAANAPQNTVCGAANCGDAVPQTAERVLDPKTSTTVKPPPKPKSFTYDDLGFLQFWEVYPLKRDKGTAYRIWQRKVPQDAVPQVVAAAQRYAVERRGEDPATTKYPSGWLNGERWLDEPLAAPVGVVDIHDHEKYLRELEERDFNAE